MIRGADSLRQIGKDGWSVAARRPDAKSQFFLQIFRHSGGLTPSSILARLYRPEVKLGGSCGERGDYRLLELDCGRAGRSQDIKAPPRVSLLDSGGDFAFCRRENVRATSFASFGTHRHLPFALGNAERPN